MNKIGPNSAALAIDTKHLMGIMTTLRLRCADDNHYKVDIDWIWECFINNDSLLEVKTLLLSILILSSPYEICSLSKRSLPNVNAGFMITITITVTITVLTRIVVWQPVPRKKIEEVAAYGKGVFNLHNQLSNFSKSWEMQHSKTVFHEFHGLMFLYFCYSHKKKAIIPTIFTGKHKMFLEIRL